MKVNNFVRNLKPLTIGFVIVSFLAAVGAIFFWQAVNMHRRHAEVALIGAQVMPFDLEATMHEFKAVPNGGLQTVTANDPTDSQQIELIQSHLKEESIKFQNGNFSDPAKIHGENMPGLASLQAGSDTIDIQYTALSNGGQIRYVTDDAELVTALHTWFEAQRSDHGHHAK
ncbi:MAG: aspartate carbamoyltransferase [Cyanobacteria bacterium J06614_10]